MPGVFELDIPPPPEKFYKEEENGKIILKDCVYPLRYYANRYCEQIEYDPGGGKVVVAFVTDGWAAFGCSMTDYCVEAEISLDELEDAEWLVDAIKNAEDLDDFKEIYDFVKEFAEEEEEEDVENEEEEDVEEEDEEEDA